VPGTAGSLVHEGGQRLGVEEREQGQQEDADQHRERRQVKLACAA